MASEGFGEPSTHPWLAAVHLNGDLRAPQKGIWGRLEKPAQIWNEPHQPNPDPPAESRSLTQTRGVCAPLCDPSLTDHEALQTQGLRLGNCSGRWN